MREFETDAKNFNLDLICPHCGYRVRATAVAGPVCSVLDTYAFLICKCPRQLCDAFFVNYDRVNRHVTQVFPYPKTTSTNFHNAIPGSIREDFAEAKRCYFAEAFKGVVVLCRRIMQSIAKDKGIKEEKLYNAIDEMMSKGLITKNLCDAAHEIRHFGNFGAHPQDDQLDNTSRENARLIIELTEDFLRDLYVRPYQIEELSNKRQDR